MAAAPSSHIPRGSLARGEKKAGGWDQRQTEQVGPPQRKPQGRSGPSILLGRQLISVSPRPRDRAALSQGAEMQVVVNILEILSLLDTRPISLTNTATLSRGALAASGTGS